MAANSRKNMARAVGAIIKPLVLMLLNLLNVTSTAQPLASSEKGLGRIRSRYLSSGSKAYLGSI